MIDKKTIEKLKKISRVQWSSYYDQLRLYAESLCRKWTWRTGSKENLPKGYCPKTIVQEGIKRLLNGKWQWDHEKYPEDSPIRFLKSEIKGFISNLGRSQSHKTYSSLEQETIKINGNRCSRVRYVVSGNA